MKHLSKSWLTLIGVCLFKILNANPVDSLTLAKVARVHLLQYVEQYEGLEFVTKRLSADGTPLYYVFNHKNNGGFVIIAADDASYPILGYATTGRFTLDNAPPQLTGWLSGRATEISYIKQKKFAANADISRFWQQLKNPAAAARVAQGQAVGPLLTTKWNQAPYYNDLCPGNGRQRAVTGCVATAMAQLMKYHNYPKTGQGYRTYISQNYGQLTANFGNTTYQWSAMPDSLTGPNLAVATLMYHCGVSMEMDYGLIDAKGNSTSGAYSEKAAEALTKYFGYAATTRLVRRSQYASDAAWIALLKAELDAKRPMEYNGRGSEGGHSFVCEGYDDNNLFYFNWGWGGKLNGYFSINNLNPGAGNIGSGTGTYNDGQGAIIGIQPAAADTTYNLQLTKKLTVSPNMLALGGPVSVSFNVANEGGVAFKGDYCVALFTEDGDFIDLIGDIKSSSDLLAGQTYPNDLVFSKTSLFLSEGSYVLAALYREPQKDWKAIGNAKFPSYITVQTQNVTSDLAMYRRPIQPSSSPLVSGQPFRVTAALANFGATAFEGDLRLSLFKLDGSFAANIEVREKVVLSPDFYLSSVFSTTGLTIAPGTYLMAMTYRRKTDTGFFPLAGYKDDIGTYPNLIRVVVVSPALLADRFEPNNTEAESAILPVTFANNLAPVTTEGSNLHVDSDLDYYKLALPTGYSYEITARLHDSDNAGNGKTYTANVIFSYKVDTGAYSKAFNVSVNDINDKIKLANGGTVVFKVAPYFAGETGTYLLDIQVSRTLLPKSGRISTYAGNADLTMPGLEPTWSDAIKLYPVPTQSQLTIEAPASVCLEQLNLTNLSGATVLQKTVSARTNITTLTVAELPKGIYVLTIQTDKGAFSRKVLRE